MLKDYQDEQRKKAMRVQSFMDFTMGGFLIFAGVALLIYKVGNLADINRKGLGILFILYGVWRIFRGYQKTRNQ